MEKKIIHENGTFWVLNQRAYYYVMKAGITHSESLCAFDKPCLAVAYCDYQASREQQKARKP